jgi:predicted Zn-dependent peptidase
MGQLLPAMTQAKLDNQRDVVINERRWSVDNQPYGTWWEKLPALAYPAEHPFHHSLIGSIEDLTAASLEDVEQFFATWYTPDNAVLSIAGDFDEKDARQLVERYFGPIPRGRGRPPLPPMDLPPTFGEPLRQVVEDEVMLPRVYMAFRSPPFGSDEYYAASVAGAILGMGKGSRLQRALLRDREVASEVNAFTFDLAKGADVLVIEATALEGVDEDLLVAGVESEATRMRDEGVTDDEVLRAVALIETAYVSSMQSAGDRADRLSMFATYFGDPGLVNEQVDRYRGVTAAGVSQFARERLGTGNRAALIYTPRRGEAASALVSSAAEGLV